VNIAIIGAGNVGKALGTSLGRAGHQVTLAATTPESARAAAQKIR
jgi:predicted dinucleotide-binding enzyme